MASNVKSYTDAQILDRVRGLSTFKGFPNGPMDVWVRSNEDAYDQFDDKVYTFECFGDGKEPQFVMVCSGTSNAGSAGLMNYQKYNRAGCAVLKSDTIIYNSHVFGRHRGYPAYQQSRGFPYFRDRNKNRKAEEVGQEYNDVIGANCHKAGVHSTTIKNWSVACLVRNQLAQWNKWLGWMRKRPLTVAILKEW